MIKELRNVVYDIDNKKRLISELEPYVGKASELEGCKNRLDSIARGDTSEMWDLQPIENVEAANFGFIQKHITRRRQYKEYKKSLDAREKQIAKEKKDTQDRILDLEGELAPVYAKTGIRKDLHRYVQDLQSEIEIAESKNTPADMGLTFDQAAEMLEQRGITPTLTEEDKQVAENNKKLLHDNKPFEKVEDFVFVHKTRFAPSNDEIKSDISAGATNTKKQNLDGIDYEYQYEVGRDTVHFTVNGSVKSHSNGNWDDCRYAAYIPAQDLLKQGNILNVSPQDTWTNGNAKFSKGTYVICPASEIEDLKKNNPETSFIAYEGKNTMTYDQLFVSMMGYSPRKIGEEAWEHESQGQRGPDTEALKDIFGKAGVKSRDGVHYHSKEISEEKERTSKSMFFGLLAAAKEKILENKGKGMPTTELKKELERLIDKYELTEEEIRKLEEIGVKIDPSKDVLEQVFDAIDEEKFTEKERTITTDEIEKTVGNVHDRLGATPPNKKQEVLDVINDTLEEREEQKPRDNRQKEGREDIDTDKGEER